MTMPALIESAHLEIAGDSEGLVLQLKDWSKVLTGSISSVGTCTSKL